MYNAKQSNRTFILIDKLIKHLFLSFFFFLLFSRSDSESDELLTFSFFFAEEIKHY